MSIRLNEKQKEAVEHKEGPLLIIAGAGTGKTSVITQRIIHIIKKKWAKPSEILALTFTDKAAQEMIERIDIEMEYGYEEPLISTFHSFCDRILKTSGHYIGLDTSYSLMTQAQSYIFMRKHIFDFPLDIFRPQGNPTQFINDMLKHFSRLQDEDCSPSEYSEFVKSLSQKTKEEKDRYLELKELAETYEMYSKLKIKESKMDFGDLITYTLKLLRERPTVLRKYQEQFKYILVDEFQDTNYAQNLLVNTLVLGKDLKNTGNNSRNLTVVGDDDQAIYKFRGAAISNILQFKEVYPDAKEIVLTENYRSRQEILDSAYDLIRNNNPNRLEVTEKIDKKLVSRAPFEKLDQEAVRLVTAGDENSEAEWVVQEILKLTKTEGTLNNQENISFDTKGQASMIKTSTSSDYRFSDFAILTRSNAQADIFIQTLRYHGIPYKVGGQRGLYTRDEIQNLISFLKILIDYSDGISMFKLLSMKIWGFTPRELVELHLLARKNNQSLLEQLEQLFNIKLGENEFKQDELESNEYLEKFLCPVSIASLSDFLLIIHESMKKIAEGLSIGQVLYDFITDSGYINYLMENESSENNFKVSNISKFFNLLKDFEKDNPTTNIYEYVDYLDYCIKVGESPSVDDSDFTEFDGVNILTVHSAKGLEFPVVFLCNLVSDRFPSRNMSERIAIPDELIKESISADLDSTEEHIHEERRLFYVGATRAKDRLYLTAANYYGNAKRKKKPSLFLYEILNSDVKKDFDSPEVGGVKESHKEKLEHYDGSNDIVVDYMAEIDTTKRVSYSQLNTYEDCPKKYEYSYIYKVPSKPNASLSFGSSIHNTLRDFYTIHREYIAGLEGIVPKPDLNQLLDFFEKNWIVQGYDSKEHEQKRKKSGIKLLKNFYKNLYTGEERIYGIEESFKVNIGGSTFVGKIDRIDLLESNNGKKKVEIVDYKTGKVKDESVIKKDLQLPLYAFFAELKLGLEVVGAKYIFVESGDVVDVDVSQERKEVAREMVDNIIDMIKEKDFSPKPGFLCRYCDYNTICEEAMV